MKRTIKVWSSAAAFVMVGTAGMAGLSVLSATPAGAHTPSVVPTCSALNVSGQNYNTGDGGDANSLKVTVDGSVVDSVNFGSTVSFTDTWANDKSHTYDVSFKAFDDPNGTNGWTKEFKGTQAGCVTPTPTPTVTVTATVTATPSPAPTVTKTTYVPVPGPTVTVTQPVPGPTVTDSVPVPGPTVTATATVTATPKPAPTVTITATPKPTPRPKVKTPRATFQGPCGDPFYRARFVNPTGHTVTFRFSYTSFKTGHHAVIVRHVRAGKTAHTAYVHVLGSTEIMIRDGQGTILDAGLAAAPGDYKVCRS